jgi:hypothetical protein
MQGPSLRALSATLEGKKKTLRTDQLITLPFFYFVIGHTRGKKTCLFLFCVCGCLFVWCLLFGLFVLFVFFVLAS